MKRERHNQRTQKGSIAPKKSLGQNFLRSKSALNKIIDAGDLKAGETVLEIGPGEGILTGMLLEKGAKVIAVEKDNRLIPILKEKFSSSISSGSLTLIHSDILDFSFSDYGLRTTDYKLIANIPYYITGAILEKFLESKTQPSLIVLLVQKEVALRAISRDGKESILSMSIKLFGEPELIGTIKAGSFYPTPKVDSAILKIKNISNKNLKGKDPQEILKVIKQGFAHKRKTLAHNLKSLGITPETIKTLTGNEKIRAEELNVDQWLNIVSSEKILEA